MTKTVAEIAAQMEEPFPIAAIDLLPKGTVERACEECGKPFQTKMKRIRIGWGRFCSRSCAATGRARARGFSTGEASKAREQQYKKHYAKQHNRSTVTRTCEECGKEFQMRVDASRDRNGHGRFCSRSCSGIGTARAKGHVVGRSSAQFYRELSHEQRREQYIKVRYGLSLQTFNAMMVKQQHRCAICKQEFQDIKPYVDHNHETGEVRGLLCNDCNLILGHAKDNEEILHSAMCYLATAR